MRSIFISGATSGIGKATALLLAERGYRILAHGRERAKLDGLKRALDRGKPGAEHRTYQADLTSFEEIDRMIGEVKSENHSLFGIISNAALFSHEKVLVPGRQIEQTFMVNQLAAYKLINGLMDLLKTEQGEKHILQVSSMAHTNSIDLEQVVNPEDYDGYRAYGESKLCNILMVKYLAPRVAAHGILVNALHPGVIDTAILREGWGDFGAPVTVAAKTILQSLENQVPENSGDYFVNALPVSPASIAENHDIQEACWRLQTALDAG
ncbi:MAG: SDR family NAD(P)-dependent oxidoreductase [Bacteroidota bacterium]